MVKKNIQTSDVIDGTSLDKNYRKFKVSMVAWTLTWLLIDISSGSQGTQELTGLSVGLMTRCVASDREPINSDDSIPDAHKWLQMGDNAKRVGSFIMSYDTLRKKHHDLYDEAMTSRQWVSALSGVSSISRAIEIVCCGSSGAAIGGWTLEGGKRVTGKVTVSVACVGLVAGGLNEWSQRRIASLENAQGSYDGFIAEVVGTIVNDIPDTRKEAEGRLKMFVRHLFQEDYNARTKKTEGKYEGTGRDEF